MQEIPDQRRWSEQDWKLYNAGMAEGIARTLRGDGLDEIMEATRALVEQLHDRIDHLLPRGQVTRIQEAHRVKGGLMDRLEKLQRLKTEPEE